MPALSPPASWATTAACLTIIILATILSFSPAADNEFLYWDDENNLMFNTYIRSFSAENLRWMWTTTLLGVWQPVAWMTTAAEYRLFDGADLAKFSRGMHLASIGLHGVAAVLAFFVVRRLIVLGAAETAARSPLGLSIGATVAALLFAVHPLRVETTAWASGQPYILAIVPALAAVWCYLLAWQTGRKRWHGAALACLALSLLCKALAVPLVAVLLVLDFYPLRRLAGAAGWKPSMVLPVLLEKVPYALLTLAAAALTAQATWSTKSYTPEPASTKLLVASFCMLFYVSMTFVPYHPAPYYMRPTPFDRSDPWFIGAAVACVVLTSVFILIRRRRPWLLAAWSAYVLVLLPVVGLVKHGGQMAADRYSYLSCVGWVALVGAGVLRVWGGETSSARSVRRIAVLVLGGAVVVGLGLMTRSYCRDWKDSESLWSAMIARNPGYWMGYYNLAKANKRPCDSLLAQADEAERRGNAATAAQLRGEAVDHYRTAETNYRKAIELYEFYPEANVDLGNMMRNGQAPGGVTGAEACYRNALRGRAEFHMAHFNLGLLLMEQKHYEEAVDHLERAEADAERAGEEKRLPTIRQVLAQARAHAHQP